MSPICGTRVLTWGPEVWTSPYHVVGWVLQNWEGEGFHQEFGRRTFPSPGSSQNNTGQHHQMMMGLGRSLRGQKQRKVERTVPLGEPLTPSWNSVLYFAGASNVSAKECIILPSSVFSYDRLFSRSTSFKSHILKPVFPAGGSLRVTPPSCPTTSTFS